MTQLSRQLTYLCGQRCLGALFQQLQHLFQLCHKWPQLSGPGALKQILLVITFCPQRGRETREGCRQAGRERERETDVRQLP